MIYPQVRPARGSARRERTLRRLAGRSREQAAGAAAKKRDGYKCRWPHKGGLDLALCRRSAWLEAMHWKPKGMGGNKDGSRNVRRNLITGCHEVHQGVNSLHSGHKRIRPLTAALMDGPCAFEEKRAGRWVEVFREP